MKKLCILSCLIIACLFLLVNTSYGRYLINNVFEMNFKGDTSLKMVTLLDTNKDENNHYKVLESVIDNNKLSFLVANGYEDNYSKVDQIVNISCFVSIGYGDIYDEVNDKDLLRLSLMINNNEYLGKAIIIDENSSLINKYGLGYLYKFYNSSLEELDLTLIGGQFNYEEVTLNIDGFAIEECELRVMVNGRDN